MADGLGVKPVKIPKALGACADLLYEVRQRRLEADKLAAAWKEQEQRIIDHVVDNLPKESSGAMGKGYMVRVITKQKPQVKDWDAFWEYVRKNKAYDLLQKRISDGAVQDRLMDKKKLPGVELFTAVTVSLTKVPK